MTEATMDHYQEKMFVRGNDIVFPKAKANETQIFRIGRISTKDGINSLNLDINISGSTASKQPTTILIDIDATSHLERMRVVGNEPEGDLDNTAILPAGEKDPHKLSPKEEREIKEHDVLILGGVRLEVGKEGGVYILRRIGAATSPIEVAKKFPNPELELQKDPDNKINFNRARDIEGLEEIMTDVLNKFNPSPEQQVKAKDAIEKFNDELAEILDIQTNPPPAPAETVAKVEPSPIIINQRGETSLPQEKIEILKPTLEPTLSPDATVLKPEVFGQKKELVGGALEPKPKLEPVPVPPASTPAVIFEEKAVQVSPSTETITPKDNYQKAMDLIRTFGSVDLGSKDLKTWEDIVNMMAEKYPENKLLKMRDLLLSQQNIFTPFITNESEIQMHATNLFREIEKYEAENNDASLRLLLFPNNSEYSIRGAITNPIDSGEQQRYYQDVVNRLGSSLYAVEGLVQLNDLIKKTQQEAIAAPISPTAASAQPS